MNKVQKMTLAALASLTVGGSAVAVNNLTTAVPTAAAASRENIDIANRDIANCQQYESNDKQFDGFNSIRNIQYLGASQIKVTVNDDFYQLSKPRRDLLIDSLQNGVIGTLMDDQQQKIAEGDVHKGLKTKVYLNNQLIGQSSQQDHRVINWRK